MGKTVERTGQNTVNTKIDQKTRTQIDSIRDNYQREANEERKAKKEKQKYGKIRLITRTLRKYIVKTRRKQKC